MKSKRALLSCVLAAGAIAFHATPAAADETIYAIIYLTNDSPNTYFIPSSGKYLSGGEWSTAHRPMNNSTYNGWTVGGHPPGVIGPGQTIAFESQSNGGFLATTGTGGSVAVPGAGDLWWSAPWGYFHGFPGEFCNGGTTADGSNGGSALDIAGGFNGSGVGAFSCTFSYHILSNTPLQPVLGGMTNGQALANGTPFNTVSSQDGRLTLQLQGDGNLVLVDYGVKPAAPLWASNTFNTTASVALMQGDGNFVLYDVDGNALWSSGTWNNPGAYLTVQTGFLSWGMIVHAPGGAPL
ncbi:MAG: hypothetical protein M3O46_07565, partial [Myxococcota bacterium]|nr:hypothetical protein [Myxococcota bacterium]